MPTMLRLYNPRLISFCTQHHTHQCCLCLYPIRHQTDGRAIARRSSTRPVHSLSRQRWVQWTKCLIRWLCGKRAMTNVGRRRRRSRHAKQQPRRFETKDARQTAKLQKRGPFESEEGRAVEPEAVPEGKLPGLVPRWILWHGGCGRRTGSHARGEVAALWTGMPPWVSSGLRLRACKWKKQLQRFKYSCKKR